MQRRQRAVRVGAGCASEPAQPGAAHSEPQCRCLLSPADSTRSVPWLHTSVEEDSYQGLWLVLQAERRRQKYKELSG